MVIQETKLCDLSNAETEYNAAGSCCVQLLWMRQTLKNFGYIMNKVLLICDNESAIKIANNLIDHNYTKHTDIWYHFLRDYSLKENIDMHHV